MSDSAATNPATPATTAPKGPLRYRVLTGPDDSAFCERVSAALDDGYELHGSPSLAFNGERTIVAQAIVLAQPDS